VHIRREKSIILHHKRQFLKHFGVLMAKNLCNLWLKIGEICVLSFQHRKRTSTKDYVRKNNLFMQNEPKFRKSQINVTVLLTSKYAHLDTWSIGKNEPKTNPNEPKTNPIKAKKTTQRTQTNPIQTQYKANFKTLPGKKNDRFKHLFLYKKSFLPMAEILGYIGSLRISRYLRI
jgi:hypothetical protein